MRADQLHDLLDDARSHETPADPTAGRAGVARVARRRQAQHIGIVAAIVVVAVAVFVRSFPIGGEDSVDTVDDPIEVPRLVPGSLPAGFTGTTFRDFPDDLDDLGAGTVPPVMSRAWLWRPTGSDGWDEAVGVLTMVLPDGVDSDPAPGVQTTPDGLSSVARAEGGVMVMAMGRGQDPDVLEAFLASADVDEQGDLVAAAPPDGWPQVIDGERTDVTGYVVGFDRPAHVSVFSAGDDPDAAQILVLASAAPAESVEIERFLLGGEQRRVDIDGTSGWLLHRAGGASTSVDSDGNETTTSDRPVPVVWWARDGVVVQVEARGFTDDEALDIARSLRSVSEEEWAVLRDRAAAASTDDDDTSCTILPDGSQECDSTGTFEGQGTPIEPTTTVTGDPTGTTTG